MSFHPPIRPWVIGALVGLSITLHAENSASEDTRSLKQAAAGRFPMGMGTSPKVLVKPADAELVERDFQILTPDACMKPQAVQPLEHKWDFKAADRSADFARNQGLEVAGHCLVWAKDDRTSAWTKEENGAPVSRETCMINPYPDGVLAELQQQLAAKYLELFEVFVENSDIIERVSFWNLHDEESGLNVFPWKRVKPTCFFKCQRHLRPSFAAVCQFLITQGNQLQPSGKTPG